ncbi:hypothetical protein GYMLUDRAFT_65372 [Collybiopsis luxurians FD-317 M1]|uniref:Uncharacterized protein n=1 Tax=Collybiopsis luxurians FD-317 M1 TaxID=944289 RepID=A0A0D0BL97_9AGAR|nr:hypothetical protein GYMLUDRAFT_65372 [Collybiopsis luxurians FD-317 M1]
MVNKIFDLFKNKQPPFNSIITNLDPSQTQVNIKVGSQLIALVLPPEASKELVNNVLAVLAPKSAQQLFDQENGEVIKAHMNQDNLKFKAAAKAVWEELPEGKKDGYECQSRRIDIQWNQDKLPSALSVLLAFLGQLKRVGPMEAFIVVLLQTPDGDISCEWSLSVAGGSSSQQYEPVKLTLFQNKMMDCFKNWADSVLPQRSHCSNLQYDDKGLSIFPCIKLEGARDDQSKTSLCGASQASGRTRHRGAFLTAKYLKKFDPPFHFSECEMPRVEGSVTALPTPSRTSTVEDPVDKAAAATLPTRPPLSTVNPHSNFNAPDAPPSTPPPPPGPPEDGPSTPGSSAFTPAIKNPVPVDVDVGAMQIQIKCQAGDNDLESPHLTKRAKPEIRRSSQATAGRIDWSVIVHPKRKPGPGK